MMSKATRKLTLKKELLRTLNEGLRTLNEGHLRVVNGGRFFNDAWLEFIMSPPAE